MLAPAVRRGEALAECVTYVNTERAVFGDSRALGSASSQPSQAAHRAVDEVQGFLFSLSSLCFF